MAIAGQLAQTLRKEGSKPNQLQTMKLTNRIYHPSALLTEFDRLFNESFPRRSDTHPSDVGVYEAENAWFLRIDLPGCGRDNISLAFEKGTLTLTAEQTSDVTGLPFPPTRSFQLPENVDASKISARLESGVLEITLPKLESTPPDRLNIEVQ